ncbi:kelch-like protein 12 isoform X1 [Hydra vulgaris]|uniref:Kelch-like protein 12 isoform X1 n=2 Tax=Hydra vulgaris TaxID=6087 RepID=A0ABM4DQH1_HYDVU
MVCISNNKPPKSKCKTTPNKKEIPATHVEENHLKDVLKRVDSLRHHGQLGFCDVILRLDGHEFSAHKIILASCSDYFYAMFNGNMKESKEKIIEINSVSLDVMKLVLNFIYTGSIQLSNDNVEDVLQAANLMLIKSLKDVCCRFLETLLTVNNCLGMQKFSESYACENLFSITTNFIHENFGYVMDCDEFLQMQAAQLEPILASDELRVLNEEHVYEALIRWIKYDIKIRKLYFLNLLSLIRLPLVSPDYLVDRVETEPLINEFPKCKELLLEAHHYMLLPNRKIGSLNSRTRPRKYENGNEILVACGGNGEPSSNSTVFTYHMVKNYWNELPRMVPERGYHGLATINGEMFVVGGITTTRTEGRESTIEMLDTVKKYDMEQAIWVSVASLHARRSKMSVIECAGNIYAIGGFDGAQTLNSVECYCPITDRWKFVSPMITHRRCTCAVSCGNFIFVVGGHDGAQILNTIETYDVERDVWSNTEIAPMTDRRSFPCAVNINDEIYVMGGYDGHDTLRSCEFFSISGNEWVSIEPMSVARSNAGAIFMNRKIYVVGGWDGVSLNSVEYYDLVTHEWVRISSLPRPATGIRCGILINPTLNEQKPRQKSNKANSCLIS